MAENDEDALLRGGRASLSSAAPDSHDISDETQDFRFLNLLSSLPDTANATIPKRGEKDFEPNPTKLQGDALNASRDAMHAALSFPRLHNPRTVVRAVYSPSGRLIPPEVARELGGRDVGGDGDDGNGNNHAAPPIAIDHKDKEKPYGVVGDEYRDACVCVPFARGQFFKSIGKSDRFNRMWLLPEEALYLLERGSLDIRWPALETVRRRVWIKLSGNGPTAAGVGNGDDDGWRSQIETCDVHAEDGGVPLSVQAAYALFLGRGGLTLERYQVYSGLKRSGYSVVRAPSWYEDVDEGCDENKQAVAVGPARKSFYERIVSLISSITSPPKPCVATGPLIGLGAYRNYDSIFRALSLIPSHDVSSPEKLPSPNAQTPSSPYRLSFYVYKPNTPLRKTNPPPPDFRLCVLSTTTDPFIPTLPDLANLFARYTPPTQPTGGGGSSSSIGRVVNLRLKHGWRNVVVAVVDNGVVSFLRIADSGFGREKLYETATAGQGKGKGGGGGGQKKRQQAAKK